MHPLKLTNISSTIQDTVGVFFGGGGGGGGCARESDICSNSLFCWQNRVTASELTNGSRTTCGAHEMAEW